MRGGPRPWRWLTGVPATVTDPGQRRALQLLLALLAVIIVLGGVSIGIQRLVIPGYERTLSGPALATLEHVVARVLGIDAGERRQLVASLAREDRRCA